MDNFQEFCLEGSASIVHDYYMHLGEEQRKNVLLLAKAEIYGLLATFDANKKLLYVKEDGEIIGRAIIRLTKCSDSKKESRPDGRRTGACQ